MAVRIETVEPGSAAQKAGLRGGMTLLAVDGHPIRDGLDYEFYTTPATLRVTARLGRQKRAFAVQKREYEPLGCVFGSYLIDAQHHCKNACVFCFIDQLPPGMRDSLYFKDDDERLGFLFGNYVTLTNLSEAEIERIIEMRISPVNISVHTANPELRVRMMKNPKAGEVLAYIPRLAAAGIALNFQLVLCPGLNDGDELRRSIEWLAGFAPAAQSIAAVPVGLTRHRESLPELRSYDKTRAGEQLDILLEYGERFARQGSRLVYPSDEWFLLAGRPLPEEAFYEDYPQLENGVGMWRLFYEEFANLLEQEQPDDIPRSADLVTGALAAPLMERLMEMLQGRFPATRVRVHRVDNDFFGLGVTVNGLLTGGDIAGALKGKLASGRLLLSALTLRAEGDRMLDDMTLDELAARLGAEVLVVPQDGAALLETILEECTI